ncbi:MAG TPA: four helix bundle protein [Gemmatimonadaceae bacterium]|nr:four helix bundle protein [Gemmatimonadaceae bacterium]
MPFRYSDLIVWQKSMDLAREIYRVTASFPVTERYGLTSQLRRAAVSVPSNIAEGHGRASTGEYLNQLSVARGSLFELETMMLLAEQLEYADPGRVAKAKALTNEIDRMLVGLRSKLARKKRGPPSSPLAL